MASLLIASPLLAAPRLPGFFTDHMVLQRDIQVPLWGWADAGEKVTISFAGQSVTTTTTADGRWRIDLAPLSASSQGHVLTVSCPATKDSVILKDVVVGDVWLCGGQSNMEWSMGGLKHIDDELAAADYSMIRHLKIPYAKAQQPAADVQSSWIVCTPRSVRKFTAVGYFFARILHKELDVPIGLIGINKGGSRIMPWIPPQGLSATPELVLKEKDILNAGYMFNPMVHPLVPYAIRGAIWYQGESNRYESANYDHKMRALISGWRHVWKQGDFPFYFVQLANLGKPNENPKGGSKFSTIREFQRLSLSIPRTGMAVTIDIGEANNIHPQNKQDVGLRLALIALADEYGRKDLVFSGPLYKSHTIEGSKIRIAFDHTGSGLMVGKKDGRDPAVEDRGGALAQFAISGPDDEWHWANATIEGDTVVVSSPDVQTPVAVRYAYSGNPVGCNLYNREGLPASPFRTDPIRKER
jgi:sialate O-acetylesterase